MASGQAPAVREPPVYRPFALIALAATLVVGTPLGTWMLARLHWGGGPVSAECVWLHAHLQAFGFFGTLIVGVAHHLVPWFAGRPVTVTPLAPWLAGALGAALGLRIAGAAAGVAMLAVAAALLQALAFGLFGCLGDASPRRAASPAHAGVPDRGHGLARPRPLVLEAGLCAWAIATRRPGGGPDPAGWERRT